MIDSRLTGLGVRIAFQYGSPSMQAADWNQPDKHETRIIADGKLIERQLDGDAYFGDDRCSAWRNEYRHRRLDDEH